MQKRIVLASTCFLILCATSFFIWKSNGRQSAAPAVHTTVPTASAGAQAQVVMRLCSRVRVTADTTPVLLSEGDPTIAGVKVVFVPASSTADQITKIRNGEIDAAAGISLETLLQQATGNTPPPFRLYAIAVDHVGDPWVSLVVHKDANVLAIPDLADKLCICAPNDQAEYLLRAILTAGGVPKEHQRVQRHGPSPLLQFKSGEAAAILTAEPVISLALADGHHILEAGPISKWLFNGKDIAVAGSVIADEFVKQHPREAKAFIEAVFAAADIQKTNPSSVRMLFAKELYGGLPPEAYNHFSFSRMVPADSEAQQSTQTYADRLFTDGVLKTRPQLGNLFPTRGTLPQSNP